MHLRNYPQERLKLARNSRHADRLNPTELGLAIASSTELYTLGLDITLYDMAS